MSQTGRPDEPAQSAGDDGSESRSRVRQIVVVFVVIFVITGALTALHALLPGNPLDQLVSITPIVLIGLVIVTLWLLVRQARSR